MQIELPILLAPTTIDFKCTKKVKERTCFDTYWLDSRD